MKHGTDTIMTVTAFGMFVYSTFTIIAGRGSVRVGATSTIPLIPGHDCTKPHFHFFISTAIVFQSLGITGILTSLIYLFSFSNLVKP